MLAFTLAFLTIHCGVKALRLTSSSDEAPKLRCAELSRMKTAEPFIIVSVFDKEYSQLAARMAATMKSRNLTWVGICDGSCAQEFSQFYQGDGNSVISFFNCPEYFHVAEDWMPQTKRCSGWRSIQYVKVAAVHDLVVRLGRNIMVLDLDNQITQDEVDALAKQAVHNTVDMLFQHRDGGQWPSFWNIGKMYIQNTESSKSVIEEVKQNIASGWDQELFNKAMHQAELDGSFRCRAIHDEVKAPGSSLIDLKSTRACDFSDASQPLCLCGLETNMSWNSPQCSF